MKHTKRFRYLGETGWAVCHKGRISNLKVGTVPYNFSVQTTWNRLEDLLEEVWYTFKPRPIIMMQ